MAPTPTNKPMTAEEQHEHDSLIAIQMENLATRRWCPKPDMTFFEENRNSYIPKFSRYSDGKRVLTSAEVKKVNAWRSAAATGNVLECSIPVPAAPRVERVWTRADVQKILDAAKIPVVEDLDWVDVGKEEIAEGDYVLV